MEKIKTVELNGKYFHINLKGEPLYENRFDLAYNFTDGVATVKLDDQYFHINLKGEPLYKDRFDWVSNPLDGIAQARLNDQYFHINLKGEPLYENRFDWVGNPLDGIAQARLGDGYFHINLKGEPLYENRFDWVDDFKRDIAIVISNGKYSFIGKNGKSLSYKPISNIGSRNDTLFIIKRDNGTKIFYTGCFTGTLEEFEDAVKKTHKSDSKPYCDYMRIIDIYK